jgi:hypothetical protein
MAHLKGIYEMYEVKEYFRGVLFKVHGPFESKDLAQMYIDGRYTREDGVEYVAVLVE